MLTTNDIAILRQLAETYISLATLPSQEKTRQLWYALNRLDMKKPMVLIDQLPWTELNCPELTCVIADGYWRGVEQWMRRSIYKMVHMPVDMVLTPYIQLPRPIKGHTVQDYGLQYSVGRIGLSQNSPMS